MTEALEYLPYDCPYCGEPNVLEVDRSEADQDLIEDCSVCCRPVELRCHIDESGAVSVLAHRDDD